MPAAASPAREPGRAPRILIPSFTPNRPPAAAGPTSDSIDSSGSPVVIPPASGGDDLIIPEGVVGANPVIQPSALPTAGSLRSGLTMAEVRQMRGTPALISRDDAAGTETWTYPDGTLIFRAGRLSMPRMAAAGSPRMEPVARRTGAMPSTPLSARRVATTTPERPRMATAPAIAATPMATTVPQAKPEPENKVVVKKVAGRRENLRTTSRRTDTKKVTARRTTRSARSTRYQRMRRWARSHRRTHAQALRRETPTVRRAAMNACSKCRTARAYLRRPRSANQNRVAAWRSTYNGKTMRGATANGVKIIQRR
jgi:hypothetical protein